MISSEEVGTILARLAIVDEAFLQCFLRAAQDAQENLLPDDPGKLEAWALLMRALRASIITNATTPSNSQK